MCIRDRIPELLFSEMKDFIESSSDFDRQSFINSALTDFLLQNGCQVKQLKEKIEAYKSLDTPIEIKIEQTDNEDYVYAYLPQKRVRIPTRESYYENNIGPSGKCMKVWGIIKNGKAGLRILNEDHIFNIDNECVPPSIIEEHSKFIQCEEDDLKNMTETFLGYELEKTISFNVFPTMVFVADFTKDSPKHFDINGTVLDALGFTSMIKTLLS